MNKHLIQTGRTTRQIEQAVALAQEGRNVYFVVETSDEQRYMRKKLAALHGVHTDVEVIRMPDHFDWETMRPADASPNNPNVVFVVDHNVVERRYESICAEVAHLQRMMHQLYPLTTGAPVAVLPLPPREVNRVISRYAGGERIE